jgi:hypothetical protein
MGLVLQGIDMKTYKTIEPIHHDGKPYAPGKQIKLEDEAAAPLIASGAISEEPIKNEPGKGPDDQATREAAIIEAIGKLNVDNKDLWLKDGRPDATALTTVLGWSVTAAERDAIWAKIKQPS